VDWIEDKSIWLVDLIDDWNGRREKVCGALYDYGYDECLSFEERSSITVEC
jgi:hypothetical protein